MRSVNTKRYDITSRRCLFAFASLLLMASPLGAQTAPSPSGLKITASFTILADMARQVAGGRGEVTSIVGPNADSHVYRATPADAKRIGMADIIILNGLGFDGFMPRLVKSSASKARVIVATKGLSPLMAGGNHGHGRQDPHAWQSIEAAKLMVANIRDGLAAADPAGAAEYQANNVKYLAELTALKVEIEALLAPIPEEKRIIVTNHDAFGYFAREFKIRFVAVQGLSTEGEPSAKDIARVIRIAKEKQARAVFVENMADPRVAAQLAKETGAKLGGALHADALSDEKGPAATYIAMMRHNARALAAALIE